MQSFPLPRGETVLSESSTSSFVDVLVSCFQKPRHLTVCSEHVDKLPAIISFDLISRVLRWSASSWRGVLASSALIEIVRMGFAIVIPTTDNPPFGEGTPHIINRRQIKLALLVSDFTLWWEPWKSTLAQESCLTDVYSGKEIGQYWWISDGLHIHHGRWYMYVTCTIQSVPRWSSILNCLSLHNKQDACWTFTMSEEGCLINYLYTAIELYLRTLTTLSTSNVVWSVVNNSKCECSLTAKTRLPPGVQWQTQHISLCPVTVGWIQKDIKYGQQRPIL